MEKTLLKLTENLIIHKGVVIGMIVSVTKGIVQIRKKDFNLLVFITDIFFAVLVGYVCWELVTEHEMWLIIKILFTGIMSGNAFVVISVLFDPNFFRSLFIGIIEKRTGIDLSDKKKS